MPIASFMAAVTQNLEVCAGEAAIGTDVGKWWQAFFSHPYGDNNTHTHTHTHSLKWACRRSWVSSDDPGLPGFGYLRITGVFVITGLLPAFAGTDDLENPNCLLCIFQVYSWGWAGFQDELLEQIELQAQIQHFPGCTAVYLTERAS